MECRGCHQETGDAVLVDLGMQPLANSLVTANPGSPGTDKDGFYLEHRYPLAPVICQNRHCQLIQLPPVPDSPFTAAYPYRSGQSETWKAHLRDLVAAVYPRLGDASVVVEVGGNDGTLGRQLPAEFTYHNIDPTADASDPRSYPVFLTEKIGTAFGPVADWVVANNVIAHVPDLDDFIAGIRAVLKPDGVLTVEVQDVNQLIEQGAWDCVYHEHYSYFNGSTLADALERRGFFVSWIEPITTHGGSVRVWAHKRQIDDGITPLRIMKPLPTWGPYWTNSFCFQLADWKEAGKRVVGYGAPAKASTWLNAIHANTSVIEYIVDSTPEKIGKFTPASHIPILAPARLIEDCDDNMIDIVVILAWNWKDEILPKIPSSVSEVWCRGERVR